MDDLANNVKVLNKIFSPSTTSFIKQIEGDLSSIVGSEAKTHLERFGISTSVLSAALNLKSLTGQLNVIVHALGILVTLPYILDADEVIESLSLGAGNTGKKHDLVTDERVAEFKFIQWRGGPESIRQNNIFKAFLNLLWDRSEKKRQLFLTGTKEAIAFLQGGRALTSVLSKDHATRIRFEVEYGQRYRTVGEFYRKYENAVEVTDLKQIVPFFEKYETVDSQ